MLSNQSTLVGRVPANGLSVVSYVEARTVQTN